MDRQVSLGLNFMRSLLIPFILLFAVLRTAAALEAAPPSIESVASGVGQRGADFEMRLAGAGLDDAREAMLYTPGVTCLGLNSSSAGGLSVRLRASADCPLGSHAFRVRTSRGLSELRTFRVTPFPVIAEEEPNSSLSDARLVPANVTIAGALEAGDVDGFQVVMRRGDRLSAEVEAVRLGGPLLDTVLSIFGPDGRELVSADDTSLFRQDPFATLIAPADGRYTVQVREVNYEGDENSRYALHLGTFPRPAFVYPAGGPAGKTVRVRFGGDATGDFEQEIRLTEAPVGNFAVLAERDGQLAPTTNPFRISPFENVLEREPNNDARSGTSSAADLPAAFNGIIERPGDQDCFAFRAAQGKRIEFEAFASRIGSPLDSVISIVDATGNLLVSNDDDGSHDSRLIFTPPQTGDYALCVSDKRAEGSPSFVYRVEATEVRPRLAVFLPRPDRTSQARQTVIVPRGNRVMAFLGAQRTGFDGEVRIVADGLPGGVSMSEAHLAPDRFWGPVVLESRVESPLAGTLAEVQARSEADGNVVTGPFVQVVDLVGGSADTLFHAVEVNRLAVAVVDESPITLSLEEPKVALARDGTIALKIDVARRDDFDGPVDVAFPFLPPWVDGPAKITIPPEQTTATYAAHALPQAESRTWSLCAEAAPAIAPVRGPPSDAAGGSPRRRRRKPVDVSVAVSSQIVSLRVSDSPVTGRIGTVAAEQGRDLELICEIKRTGRTPLEMLASLEGLPNRVSADSVAVNADDEQIRFTVKIGSSAPVGRFPGLVCRLTGVIDGQEVSYCVGRPGELRIEAAGALVTDDTGRPLSPLEVLRRARKQSASRSDR
jgi:hypothetical protein